MSNDINWNNLSAIPEDGIADKLQKAYQNKFINNLLAVIEYAEQVLDKDYNRLKQRFLALKINPPKFLSPHLYTHYFKLRQSMENDDIYAVKTIISSLLKIEVQLSACRVEAGLTNLLEIEMFNEEVLMSFGFDTFKASSPDESTLNLFKNNLVETLTLIENADAVISQEIKALVSNFFLVTSHGNVGATSPKFFGAIYASLPPDKLLANWIPLLTDNIVHESAHLYLNAIMIHDSLVLNDGKQKYHSPIRKSLRPMIGIYHASFVLSRVIRVFKKILQENLHSDRFFIERIIDETSRVYTESYKVINEHAKLTELGRRIHQSTHACLSLD